MPANGVTRAQKIRQERRDSLRELLRAQGHEQHVLDLLKKLDGLEDLDQTAISRIKISIDTRLKLISKYLPDDREPADINIGGQEDNPLNIIERKIVKASN